MALRSKTKLFSKNDQLVCVHDVGPYETGDRIVVWDICAGCLGIMVEDYPEHLQDEHFEKLTDEKFVREVGHLIEKQKVVNVFTDLMKVMVMNSNRGIIGIDAMKWALVENIHILGLEKEFKIPLNRYPEHPENESE